MYKFQDSCLNQFCIALLQLKKVRNKWKILSVYLKNTIKSISKE
jgi:hypothetical protein